MVDVDDRYVVDVDDGYVVDVDDGYDVDVKNCFFFFPSLFSELCRIVSILHLLSKDATQIIVSAFVLSHIDYCNLSCLAVLSISLTNYRQFKTMLLALS